jgi:hypothetical protein
MGIRGHKNDAKCQKRSHKHGIEPFIADGWYESA